MKSLLSLIAVALLPLSLANLHAQESTAGGNLQNEASWGALRALVGRAQGDVDILKIDVDAIRKCHDQNHLYSFKQSKCLDITDTRVQEILKCGKSNMVYSETKGCVGVGNRWFFLKNGPGMESTFSASHAKSMVMNMLAKDGVTECTSVMTEGRKCTTVGAQCAHFSYSSDDRGKQNEHTVNIVASRILKCD